MKKVDSLADPIPVLPEAGRGCPLASPQASTPINARRRILARVLPANRRPADGEPMPACIAPM